MRNFWLLRRFRPGRKVRYTGPDATLKDKIGVINDMMGSWIDVKFPSGTITVEKENLEIVQC